MVKAHHLVRLIMYAMMVCTAMFILLCGRIILITVCLIGAMMSGFLLGIIGAIWLVVKRSRLGKVCLCSDPCSNKMCSCTSEWRENHGWF
jgi:hypothetical protein